MAALQLLGELLLLRSYRSQPLTNLVLRHVRVGGQVEQVLSSLASMLAARPFVVVVEAGPALLVGQGLVQLGPDRSAKSAGR